MAQLPVVICLCFLLDKKRRQSAVRYKLIDTKRSAHSQCALALLVAKLEPPDAFFVLKEAQ